MFNKQHILVSQLFKSTHIITNLKINLCT